MKTINSNFFKLYSKANRKLKILFDNPFLEGNKKLIVHCCHHKVGTVWFKNVFRRVADRYGLIFQDCKQDELHSYTDIFLQDHSHINLFTLPDHRGSHIVRDPRDVIISGYFYHLWTEEKWANYPREEFGGKSYQKYLNSLNQEEGILAEMKRAASTDIKDMVNWNYNNPNFLEIKYEDIIKDEQKVFYNLFKHYGFRKDAIQAALKIAEQYSFKNVAKRKVGQKQQKSHLRSGKPGEWRDFFTEKHKNSFKELLGDVVVKLGYEVNNNW